MLGAVYRGEGELSKSLCSILYFAMVADAHNSQSSEGGEYSTVRATHDAEVVTQLARGNPKNEYRWL